MSFSFKMVLGGCILMEGAANFVSPGLGKCLDLEAEVTEDGDRETLKEMMKDEKTNVQLYACHGNHNQHFEIMNGQFRSFSMEGFCLTAETIEANANVHLEKCEDGKDTQQWALTGDGYVKVLGSEQCLDVKAEQKKDGSYETWDEIKTHKVNNVHLYKCHDPEKTDRVNQLWSWVPYQNGEPVTEKTVQRLWEMIDLRLSGSGPVTATSFASIAAVGLFVLGAAVGKRMRGAAPQPLASCSEE